MIALPGEPLTGKLQLNDYSSNGASFRVNYARKE
jgi:hypothetical protein